MYCDKDEFEEEKNSLIVSMDQKIKLLKIIIFITYHLVMVLH